MQPFLFLLFPLAEIATFILVGKAIGIVATLALVVASSVIGAVILRDAGLLTLFRLEQRRGDPAQVLADGGARMLAGLLLLIPGFLTDIAALAVMAPGLRGPLARGATRAMRRSGNEPAKASPTVVEGEFRRLPDNR
jgi:UPF0716 protein FxsA